MSEEASDQELLRRWAAGEASAGEALLERHFDWLYTFLYAKVEGTPDDLVQQTLLACVEQVDRLPQIASFRAYVLGIARHKLYATLRTRTAGRFDPERSSVQEALGPISGGYSRRLAELALHQALQRLPADVQLVLELHYWQELSSREIADVLEVPASTVRARIGRARELLRQELERGGPHDIDTALRVLFPKEG